MRQLRRSIGARGTSCGHLRDSLGERLRDERGIALVMALGIMLVLTIALTTTIYITSTSGRHAASMNAEQRAASLAEAGVNNAVSVLRANYPGTVAFPGDSTLLPPRQTTYDGGSCTAPVRDCVTWSGTLAGPLTGPPWRWQWEISSTATVRNPTGPSAAPITRTATAVVPVVIPPTSPSSANGPLNFIYAGADMTYRNPVNVKAPVYVTRDLTLENQAEIYGAARKLGVGRHLYMTSPQNQIGLIEATDPRIDEAHIVGQCSVHGNTTLHNCLGDPDEVYATTLDNVIPPDFLDYVPELTCCAPYSGSIPPAGASNPSNMGFWYQNADLGPLSPCTTSSGTVPIFDTASGTPDLSINNSATPTTPVNLTPNGGSYTCRTVLDDGTILGELSWNATAKLLTIKGTIFIDGSAMIDATGYPGNPVFTYTGQGTLVLTGTFGMQNSKMCAVVAGTDCNLTAGAWDPNIAALVVVADGDGGGGGAQAQPGNVVGIGEGIDLKSASFQGGLIANKTIDIETTASMQGPMISVYNNVLAGQTGDLIFPTIYLAPSGGGGVVTPPPMPELLDPRSFTGG